jgi:hypothetical protein
VKYLAQDLAHSKVIMWPIALSIIGYLAKHRIPVSYTQAVFNVKAYLSFIISYSTIAGLND